MAGPRQKAILTAATIVLLGLSTGCARNSDLEALRQEVAKTQEMARAAEAKAAAAQAEAESAKAEAESAKAEAAKAVEESRKAAAAASAASEKADRIFRESLRK